jgi:endoglucanase
MNKEIIKTLKEFTDVAAPSGFERNAHLLMKDYVKDYADEMTADNLGSFISIKNGNVDGPRIMIAGHLDEIGFMITKIDKDGYLSFQTLGGWWSQVMLAQRVRVVASNGKEFTGVIGAKPPHSLTPAERKNPADIKNMFIDLGVKDKEAVEALGIKVGDFAVPYCEFAQLADEKYLYAKAWDNRIGCYIAGEVVRRLKGEKHENVIYGVGTVQEEVGLRGGRTSSFMVEPDIGFALDVGLAGDMPGTSGDDFKCKLGDGPLITLFDSSMIGHKGLRDFVVGVAEELEIPFQYAGLRGGGTDAGAMHITKSGAPSLSLSLATRYIHSNGGIIHYDDVENAVKLLVEVCKRLDRDAVNKITFE